MTDQEDQDKSIDIDNYDSYIEAGLKRCDKCGWSIDPEFFDNHDCKPPGICSMICDTCRREFGPGNSGSCLYCLGEGKEGKLVPLN